MHDQKTKLKLKHIYLLFLKINKPKVWPPNGIMIHKVQMKITMLWHAIALFIYIWKQRIPPNLDDVRCFICVFGCVYFFFTRLQIYDLQFFTKTVVLVGLITNNNVNVIHSSNYNIHKFSSNILPWMAKWVFLYSIDNCIMTCI